MIEYINCTRCGDCCSTDADRDTWCKGRYTKEEVALLRKERAKYPEWGDTYICWMMIYENYKGQSDLKTYELNSGKIRTCLVYKLFGKGRTPECCQNWICKKN